MASFTLRKSVPAGTFPCTQLYVHQDLLRGCPRQGVHRIPLNRSLHEIVGYFQDFRIRVSISASRTVGFMQVNFRHDDCARGCGR